MGEESEGETTTTDNFGSLKGETCKTAKEYFTALEKWLQEAYMIQSVAASFPYMFMYNQMLPNIQPSAQMFVNHGLRTPPAGHYQFVNTNTNFPVGEHVRQRHAQPPVNQSRQFTDLNGIYLI